MSKLYHQRTSSQFEIVSTQRVEECPGNLYMPYLILISFTMNSGCSSHGNSLQLRAYLFKYEGFNVVRSKRLKIPETGIARCHLCNSVEEDDEGNEAYQITRLLVQTLGKLYPRLRETWTVEGMRKRKEKLARNMRLVTGVLF